MSKFIPRLALGRFSDGCDLFCELFLRAGCMPDFIWKWSERRLIRECSYSDIYLQSRSLFRSKSDVSSLKLWRHKLEPSGPYETEQLTRIRVHCQCCIYRSSLQRVQIVLNEDSSFSTCMLYLPIFFFNISFGMVMTVVWFRFLSIFRFQKLKMLGSP